MDSINSYFLCPKTALITRIDYRLDFFMDSVCAVPTVDTILLHSFSRSSIREWKKGNCLTNWQCGNKESKAVVFRLYDKKLDTEKKHKDSLYVDYNRFDAVHRIEFEC